MDRINEMINILEKARDKPRDTTILLDKSDIHFLCDEAIKILKQDPIHLELEAPITVCGDIHGQLYDLISFINRDVVQKNHFLFLGDYVDRGKNSTETIVFLLCLKVKYPKQIFLLRGNHESPEISQYYGFLEECQRVYDEAIWTHINEVFSYLPISAVIGERIFCVHGGLSPELQNVSQIKTIKRPYNVPERGLICDLLWSDPDPQHSGWTPSSRGVSYEFGKDTVEDFLNNHDYDLICRAHQDVDEGFEFPFPENTVLTIFTAPNYEGSNNKGAVLDVNEHLMCSFKIIS